MRLPWKKGFRVIITSRDEEKGKTAAEKLQNEGLDVTYCSFLGSACGVCNDRPRGKTFWFTVH